MGQQRRKETDRPVTLLRFDGIRVLVVEDEVVNRIVCKAVLQKMGIEIDIAEDGQQGIDAIVNDHYDLVLMDCKMPVMNGYVATQWIRAREQAHGLPRVPIIALTALAMPGDREACITAGMDDYLSKPFEFADLQDILLRWLPKNS